MKTAIVKTYFEDALFELLKEKRLESITVNELCKKAGVCRASFYRNYLVMNDIVDQYLQKIFTDMKPDDDNGIKIEMDEVFTNLLKQKDRLIILSKRGLLHNLFQYIYTETLSEIVNLQVLNNYYQPYFFAGASSAVVNAWIEKGMLESPQEMSQLFIMSLKGYMEIQKLKYQI